MLIYTNVGYQESGGLLQQTLMLQQLGVKVTYITGFSFLLGLFPEFKNDQSYKKPSLLP